MIYIYLGSHYHWCSYLVFAFYIYIICSSSIIVGFELASQAFCILILTGYWVIAYIAYLLP